MVSSAVANSAVSSLIKPNTHSTPRALMSSARIWNTGALEAVVEAVVLSIVAAVMAELLRWGFCDRVRPCSGGVKEDWRLGSPPPTLPLRDFLSQHHRRASPASPAASPRRTYLVERPRRR